MLRTALAYSYPQRKSRRLSSPLFSGIPRADFPGNLEAFRCTRGPEPRGCPGPCTRCLTLYSFVLLITEAVFFFVKEAVFFFVKEAVFFFVKEAVFFLAGVVFDVDLTQI